MDGRAVLSHAVVRGADRVRDLGRMVQVAPIKLVLKALRTKPLKLKVDKQLSSFAFKFNLRR